MRRAVAPGVPMTRWLMVLATLSPGLAGAAGPTVASINLCTDQLVLNVAEPEQILSLSWLSADPEESMLADRAARYPLNYGTAEELIAIDADVVIAGSETSPFTRALLRRLGATIVEIEPAASLDDIARNLHAVGRALDRSERATAAVAAMHGRAAELATAAAEPRSAIVVRPGGFTIGRLTLAHELITLAGLDNEIARLDRWGSLSVETLLAAEPAVIVTTTYRAGEASLANTIFTHPALASFSASRRHVSVAARYFACGAPQSLDATASLNEQLATR